ncbi:DeoR family transcriptional regulator [Marinomonas sp. IMCC 4694]|uniref:DeoR family transcriptional regulator n=1 Tax=Marinomonas sp. IMCC 4694 TaxID=2605432 RepID=UPI0021CCA26A|nr:DeoR family transcriptional regulator [Marinomonas sp. IMCC 4694]
MGLSERQNQILNWVQQEDALLVEDMVARFGVSSQTVRKDVNLLAEQHLIRRTHGGIAPVSSTEIVPFDHRQFLNSDAKVKIAEQVAINVLLGRSCRLLVFLLWRSPRLRSPRLRLARDQSYRLTDVVIDYAQDVKPAANEEKDACLAALNDAP